MTKPLTERITGFINTFESRIREYEEISKKSGSWTANDYLNRSEHQKLVSLLTEAREFIEQASKPLEDGELEEEYGKAWRMLDRWHDMYTLAGEPNMCKKLEQAILILTRLYVHSMNLEADTAALRDALKRKEGEVEKLKNILHDIEADELIEELE